MMDIILPLISASLTVMILSYVYDESIFFRTGEHIFIGVMAGYTSVVAIKSIIQNGFIPIINGSFTLIIPILFGCMLFGKYNKNTKWMMQWPIALLTGVGSGLAIKGIIEPDIIKQILATTEPLIVMNNGYQSFINILMLIMTASSLSYFIFSKEQTGYFGAFTRIGRLTLLVALGAAYGGTVMTRETLLLGRIQFLLTYPAYYVIPITFILIFYNYYTAKRKD